MNIIPPKPEIDFTDELITSKGGLTFLTQFASHLGLPEFLAQNLKLKVRDRGPSDVQYLLSLIYSMALYRYKTVEILCDLSIGIPL